MAGYQFEWFNKELKAVFGVDVYRHPFDQDKGYSIIKHDHVEVLVIKLEKLSCLEGVVGNFVGRPEFKLLKSNEARHKAYYPLYKDLKERIKIPRELIDLYYADNGYMNHFYSDREKIDFLQSWKKDFR
ncbi:hypothetical protein Acid7E03_43330 [Acidisoma sp. 7E03]